MGVAFSPGWQAGLEVAMRRRSGTTRMTHLRHWGPLRIQRPFYPGNDGEECHLYLLHPPGGMVTGDQLLMDIALDDCAHGLLTTPSAGKIYRGNQSEVRQQQVVRCRVSGSSYLEWLPQETIVFDGARGELDLQVNLDDDANCCLWDIVCLGRPASLESFGSGFLRQRLQVERSGVPLYRESNLFEGGSSLLNEPWGLDGHPVSGTLLATVKSGDIDLDSIREQLAALCQPGDAVAISDLGDLVAVRFIGASVAHCKMLFIACWKQFRMAMTGKDINEPRIWYT
jgi:urease accessory protein